MTRATDKAPSAAEIELIAERAYRRIPERLRKRVDAVVIRIEEFPDDEIIAEMELDTEYDLLGLYSGVALNEKSFADAPQNVDMIFLYRRPMLDYWAESGDTLEDVVRHVLIHEIGHHFGLSDEEMERIENEN
ncbi:MAG: metallopeptidase family protein [Alphaproteobacteria bacterium]|nr:metallopeptidase family protein [Alphaproteobacteria bacterium]